MGKKLRNRVAALTRGTQDLAATLRALPDAGDLDVLHGLEGEAARQYFDRQPLLVKADLRSVFSMDGRTRRALWWLFRSASRRRFNTRC
ncbi:CRISPR-associated endonuclease Cas1 [Hydrogenophaga sp. NFH-34]|uniref:CRISPR-associated endonuclease Cas1 n=1 Tax=Hydrogenophaga sp. NFH-34 TaxID=2744446 RepID=UPI001F1AD73E|nr:CRISPR-associated endonuclease Cas1 [Hydrogenophaga sp. NFH-34]